MWIVMLKKKMRCFLRQYSLYISIRFMKKTDRHLNSSATAAFVAAAVNAVAAVDAAAPLSFSRRTKGITASPRSRLTNRVIVFSFICFIIWVSVVLFNHSRNCVFVFFLMSVSFAFAIWFTIPVKRQFKKNWNELLWFSLKILVFVWINVRNKQSWKCMLNFYCLNNIIFEKFFLFHQHIYSVGGNFGLIIWTNDLCVSSTCGKNKNK